MAEDWPDYGEIAARDSGLFVEKLAMHDERLLFPKADIQTPLESPKRQAAFDPKRTS